MNEKNDFALVPRPSSAVEKAAPGAKRILSGMVADTLALTKKEQLSPATARLRIGEYEWREPDYRQIHIWAKALTLEPEEVIRRLLGGKRGEDPEWRETTFGDGMLLKLNWDFELLPLEKFEWVGGLAMTHFSLEGWPPTNNETLKLTGRLPPLALDLSGVPMLTNLDCSHTALTELDLSSVPRLTDLHCQSNYLDKLDLSSAPRLTNLDCGWNHLYDLDLSRVPMLTELNCERNRLTELDLSGLPLLTSLDCEGNRLTELDLSSAPMLTNLECQTNYLAKLVFADAPLLTHLWCSENQLAELVLGDVPMLTQLFCDNNQLTKLVLGGAPMLTLLTCQENKLNKLDLSGAPSLGLLNCEGNRIKVLDIRLLQDLQELQYDVEFTRLKQRPDQAF